MMPSDRISCSVKRRGTCIHPTTSHHQLYSTGPLVKLPINSCAALNTVYTCNSLTSCREFVREGALMKTKADFSDPTERYGVLYYIIVSECVVCEQFPFSSLAGFSSSAVMYSSLHRYIK